MRLSPTPIDLWCAEHLSRVLGRYPFIDLSVQSLIAHNVLGGFWFALSFFILWVLPLRADKSDDAENQRKLLFVLVGSLIAISIALVLAASISCLPPNRAPGLAQLYPWYFESNPNDNSFPSLSVALYASIAAGITGLRRKLGLVLWMAVVFLVALPRMYVGGHYLTDVIVGVATGIVGSAAASIVETAGGKQRMRVIGQNPSVNLVTNILVFAWVLQVAVEFRDATWLVRGLRLVISRLA